MYNLYGDVQCPAGTSHNEYLRLQQDQYNRRTIFEANEAQRKAQQCPPPRPVYTPPVMFPVNNRPAASSSFVPSGIGGPAPTRPTVFIASTPSVSAPRTFDREKEQREAAQRQRWAKEARDRQERKRRKIRAACWMTMGIVLLALLVMIFGPSNTLTVAQGSVSQIGKDFYTVSVVSGDSLNLRSGPSAKSRILSRLSNGASLDLLDEARMNGRTQWVKVQYGGRVGWVAKAFLNPSTP